MSLAKDGCTLICKEIAEEGFSHAERLHVFIEEIILEAGITFQDLNAIAVSRGPWVLYGIANWSFGGQGLVLCFGYTVDCD